MNPIVIFYHCLLFKDNELLVNAVDIIHSQIQMMREVGLISAARQFYAGINGGEESKPYTSMLFAPKTQFMFYGLQCRTENRTVEAMREWCRGHPGWFVLYLHSKGATHPPTHQFSTTWRECMMLHVVRNWRRCVTDLMEGFDAVGSHWMEPPATPEGHHIFAGNFYWITSDFLATLPPMTNRDRIKTSGIDSIESRYEAEVILGHGPRLPKVKDYHTNWNPSKMHECEVLVKRSKDIWHSQKN